MHPNNLHKDSYDFNALKNSHPELGPYIFINEFGSLSIDFSIPEAVLQLNKALLKHHYQITNWNIPEGYLCPPIPGRANYIHHITDLLKIKEMDHPGICGLDIGTGANCIYPILGASIYNWNFTASDIDPVAVGYARQNINATPGLKNMVDIRLQEDKTSIFKHIVRNGEYYNFSMCNPPFYASEEEALKTNLKKVENLTGRRTSSFNFGGKANELWCNGGEALFIKRMIKESVNFKYQIGWFTSLVSKKENLLKIEKLLKKLNANYTLINMTQGHKKSRIIAWCWK